MAVEMFTGRQEVTLSSGSRSLLMFSVLASLIFNSGIVHADEPATPKTVSDYTDLALGAITQGNYSGAAQQLRRAQSISPDDALLQNTLGAFLLNTGASSEAAEAFDRALKADKTDPLALYGRGLCRIATGDKIGAISNFDRSEANGGDKLILLMARRYSQWLIGASISMAHATLIDELQPAQMALQGMELLRKRENLKAKPLIEAALNQLQGDSILQPIGPLMTFDPKRGVDGGGIKTAAGSLKAPPIDKNVLRGGVEVSPNQQLEGVAYAAYDLDGQPLAVVNVFPFRYAFDTTRTLNGWHDLNVILYDSGINEINRTKRRVRISNPLPQLPGSEELQRDKTRSTLWKSLALRPDRRPLSYAMGEACRAQGETEMAKTWFLRTLALQGDYRDARQKWAACGGAVKSGSPVWGGPTDQKIVALTFDDGPKPGVTEPLLEILKQERAIGTFFIIGRHVIEYPELSRKIADAGMELANHSYTHPNLTKITSGRVIQEILQTQAAVMLVTGKTSKYVRPPGGNWNSAVAQSLSPWGLTPCMWTVDAYGSEVLGAQQVANAVLTQVRPGSIILMHNGKVSTLQALPTIIRELRKQGYRFVTVDDLVQRLYASRSRAPQIPAENRRIE